MRDVVLLPTYNEKENIRDIISDIFSAVPEINILVIDDNSPDGTQDVVKEIMQKDERVKLLAREKKEGLGVAYRHAMKEMLKDKTVASVITMDADGSHDPKYLKTMLAAPERCDLIIGSRYVPRGGVENWELWRKALSYFGNMYARVFIGIRVRDLTAGFMRIKRPLLGRIDFDTLGAAGYAFLMQLKTDAVRHQKACVAEFPIIFKERRGGESKISNQIIAEGLKTPLKIFWKRIWKI